ncbi:MAG: metal ABC transporter permease [Polyangiaceae bacterium]
MPEASGPSLSEFIAAWELFRDPMICGLVAGLVLGYLSVFVFMRRMVFVSAAVTQSAGLGVALAFYAEIHLGIAVEPIVGAALLALLATAALLVDSERLHISSEAILGVIFAATGGAAVIVGDRISQEAHDIQSILFGTAVLVRDFDLWVILGLGSVLLALHLWWRRGLTFATFDETAARVQGLPVRPLRIFVLLSIGLMVGAAARALGALPVFALSTLPAIAANLVGLRVGLAFAAASLFGALAGFGGYAAAYFFETPVGATQTSAAAAFVVLGLVVHAARRLARPREA